MNPPDHRPREPRATIRMDARLDAATRQTVDVLATRFHQPRAAVLCRIMHWGISRGLREKIDQGDTDGPVRHLYLNVASELHEQVQKAATIAGAKTPSWLRHMVRQIAVTDFPTSWQLKAEARRAQQARL